LEEVWRRAAADQTVFQGFTFARHWAACFADQTEMRVGWSENPAAVVPLVRRGGMWSLIGEGLFDYQDVIGRPGTEAALWTREQTDGHLQVTGVPEGTGQHKFWQQSGMEARQFSCAPTRVAGAESELPQEHPRQQRRWQAAGAQLEKVEGRGGRLRHLDWLLEHKAQGLAAQARENVLDAGARRWLGAMVESELDLAELWSLRRAGETLAGILCWRSAAVRYAYTIAYDARFAALSPGVLALYALLRQTMREGRGFNFLTGEQEFKLRFATGRETLLRYASFHPTS